MLPDKVLAAAVKYAMFKPGDLAVIAVSGGPDSAALLHSLSQIAPKLRIRLHVAHLDHKLRGEESAADAAYVVGMARGLGWPATVRERDVAELQAVYRTTLEGTARIARYLFLIDVVKETGASGAVLGHTADDQVETVLLHFLRGAGSGGLRAMRAVSELQLSEPGGVAQSVTVLRPMLEVTRAEVEAYCGERGLQTRTDSSNNDKRFLRNRVRLELLPAARRCNPAFDEAVRRAARVAAVDDDFLSAETKRLWAGVAREAGCRIDYDLEQWQALPASLQYRMLREGARKLVGDFLDVSAVHLDAAVVAMRAKPAGTVVTWPRGLRLVKRYDEFRLSRERLPEPSLSLEGERLAVPGRTVIAGGRWDVQAEVVESRHAPGEGDRGWHADLDGEKVGGNIWVRRRRPGDRFQSLGLPFEKKLQDVLVDAKVVREDRDEVPIVVAGERIAWLGGFRIADWAKVTDQTKMVLCLRINPIRP